MTARQNLSLIVTITILAATLVACAAFGADHNATATAHQAAFHETLTSLAPTNTTTSTATPSVTPSPTPGPDAFIADLALVLSDLPDGFEELSPDDFQQLVKPPIGNSFESSYTFGFQIQEDLELLFGYLYFLESEEAVEEFDLSIEFVSPFYVYGLGAAIGDEDGVDPNEFIASQVGDISKGHQVVVSSLGELITIEGVVFRRGAVGVMIFYIHPQSTARIEDILQPAAVIDERILDAQD